MRRRRVDRSAERPGGFAARALGVLAALARVTAALAVAALLAYGGVRLWEWARTSPRFAVRDIVFAGADRAPPEELAARAGLARGMNIFSVDLAAAALAMEEDPRVARVRVARELPDTLRVSVEEHRAAALALLGALYAVDATGNVFKRVGASDRYDLPLVTGLARDSFAGERRGGDPELHQALRVVDAWGRAGLEARAPLSEVHVERIGADTFYTAWSGDEPVEVRLGALPEQAGDPADALDARLGRLVRVWDELQRRGARARSIDVGNRARPDWVAARLEQAAGAAGRGSK